MPANLIASLLVSTMLLIVSASTVTLLPGANPAPQQNAVLTLDLR